MTSLPYADRARRGGWLGPGPAGGVPPPSCAKTGESTPSDEIDGGVDGASTPHDGSAGDSAATTPHDGGAAQDTGADGSSVPGDGGGGCSSLPLCDGFESDTPGAQPAGWTVVMG